MSIRQISIVTALGAETYELGGNVDGRVVNEIKIESLLFHDEFLSHYVGRCAQGQKLFTVNCSCPCVAHYLPVVTVEEAPVQEGE